MGLESANSGDDDCDLEVATIDEHWQKRLSNQLSRKRSENKQNHLYL